MSTDRSTEGDAGPAIGVHETVPMELQRVGGGRGPLVAIGLIGFLASAVTVALLFDDDVNPMPNLSVASVQPSDLAEPPAVAPAEARTPFPNFIVRSLNNHYQVPWPGMSIALIRHSSWWTSPSGTAICMPRERIDCSEGDRPNLAVHAVASLAADVCAGPERWDPDGEGPQVVPIGPTSDDVTMALSAIPEVADPSLAVIGGYPAQRFDLTGMVDACARWDGGTDPGRRMLWRDSDGSPFELLSGGTGTVYVVDVAGDRLVITTHYRDASPAEVAELDAVVASIEIEPTPVWSDSGPDGTVWGSLTTGGVPFTFRADPRWEPRSLVSLNKSFRGPQGAEAMVFWTGFPDDRFTDPCAILQGIEPSMDALATAVATAPGTDLLGGPADVTVGGRPATFVVVRVRDDRGCDPGYFFGWSHTDGGAMWLTPEQGDTIRVWIVDVDGKLLVIAGESHRDVQPGIALADPDRADIERQIQGIVESIRFGEVEPAG
jgi:hypothetical protein